MELSKTQTDRLGDRLKTGNFSAMDLEALDRYRVSHGDIYQKVVDTLRARFSLSPTGRPAKSTTSIVDKLRRESSRLSQIQDIAGCRVIVPGIKQQERVLSLIGEIFPTAKIFDRRVRPSSGYRAIHIIVSLDGNRVEIQLRTKVQHLWAELSEKLSDRNPAIKYGGGSREFRKFLDDFSELVKKLEVIEMQIDSVPKDGNSHGLKKQIADQKRLLVKLLNKALKTF